MSTEARDVHRIFIRDCRVDLGIGVCDRERHGTQPVVVNVECESSLTCRYDDIGENTLARVVDYGPIHNFIRHELPKMGHIALLENAAERIISFCLRDARVQKVRVRIEKTSVYPDAAGAGIELIRTRS